MIRLNKELQCVWVGQTPNCAQWQPHWPTVLSEARLQAPFFRLSDKSLLTKQRLITMLRSTLETAGIEASRYSGHSFRIGEATSAAACGLADSPIQTLGRWSSDSFKHYIRLPPQDLATMSKSLILC